MATTFNVIPLGVQVDLDPTEGNTQAENASALVGMTFGSLWDPLWEQFVTFSPGSTGYTGGSSNTAYDQNSTNDTFRINGGANQVFDSTATYNATITYTDGTTATITAVVFQDQNGNTYLAPEFSANADQVALQAKPIRSISLDSLAGNTYSGMTGTREAWNYMVCFTAGTLITTPTGPRRIETLRVGDLVETADRGAQPIRWISNREVPASGPFTPVRIEAGALAPGVPERAIYVSPQHRMLLRSRVILRMFGQNEAFVAAIRLVGQPGITRCAPGPHVDYWHFMCDHHEVVFANGAPAETLLLGEEARKSLSPDALSEIYSLFPELAHPESAPRPAREIPKTHAQKRLAIRLLENRRQLLEAA